MKALATMLLVSAVMLGCSRERPEELCPPTDSAQVVDPALLAFLSRARAAHRSADLHEQARRFEQAITPLEAVVGGALPGPPPGAPEAREVVADTHARLADLRSALGQFEAGLRHVTQGLEHAGDPTYFRGHLFEMRGLVEERWAADLRKRGDVDGAQAAERRALEAYEQAMAIQDQAIQRALPKKP